MCLPKGSDMFGSDSSAPSSPNVSLNLTQFRYLRLESWTLTSSSQTTTHLPSIKLTQLSNNNNPPTHPHPDHRPSDRPSNRNIPHLPHPLSRLCYRNLQFLSHLPVSTQIPAPRPQTTNRGDRWSERKFGYHRSLGATGRGAGAGVL